MIFYIRQDLDFKSKCNFLISFINEISRKMLILTKNSSTAQKVFNSLFNEKLNVFFIPAKIKAGKRKKIYESYDKIDKGILITSSLVFWEGINIKKLEIVILFNIPFPRPSLMELYHGRVKKNNAQIIKRLRQGIGRVARKPSQFGIAILLFTSKKYLIELEIEGIDVWNVIKRIKKEF